MRREERSRTILVVVNLIASAILCASASGAADVEIPHASTGGVSESWGTAGLELSLTPEQEDYCVGEPMWLTYGILNVTSSTVDLGDFIGNGRPFRVFYRVYGVSVRESSGVRVPSHLTEGWGGSFAGGPLMLAPGEGFSQRLLLQMWVRIEEPGTYEVSVALREHTGNGWVPFPEAVAKLTVIPKDPVRIRAGIDELIARLDPAFPAEEKYDAFKEASEPETPVPNPPIPGPQPLPQGVIREIDRQDIRENEVRIAVSEAEALLYPETLPALRHLLESRYERIGGFRPFGFPYDQEVKRAINTIEKATS